MALTESKKNDTTANLGFEAKLWAAGDALPHNFLPKLISGELRIEDAERYLERVL